jgi:segregation and condensation protein B
MSEIGPLARDVEALLFLAPEPLGEKELAEACDVELGVMRETLTQLEAGYHDNGRGIVLRRLGGGWALSTHPESEDAARRLYAAPRTPPLTAAQAETLAIIAYLQPVSRPEIARIRGVNAESATATLLERGLVEESGRSPFGAVLYRTGELFLRLFGLDSLEDLPDIAVWDPAPEVEQALRDRLLEVGALRSTEPTTDALPAAEEATLASDEAPSDGTLPDPAEASPEEDSPEA